MQLAERVSQIVDQLETRYQHANQASKGMLGIVRRTMERVGETRVSQASASVAYYTLFSLFPMLLFLIVVISFFMDPQEAQDLVLAVVVDVLPDAKGVQELVGDTVSTVFSVRGEVGVLSVIGLLWASSAAFTTLAYNIDLAWLHERVRPPLLQRVVGIVMILILGGAVVASLLASTVLGVIAAADFPLLQELGVDGQLVQPLTSWILAWGLPFLVFLSLYRWVPSGSVPWVPALWAALIASVAWQVVNAGFTWYLRSGLARYELVYGSVTTIIVLMFWIYLTVLIILVGAHFSASIALRQAENDD